MQEVDRALIEIIRILESEESSEGSSRPVKKYKSCRNELGVLPGGVWSPMRNFGMFPRSIRPQGGLLPCHLESPKILCVAEDHDHY